MFCPAPHLLGGVNVERTLIVSQWFIYELTRYGEFCENTANSVHIIIYLSTVSKVLPKVPDLAKFMIFFHQNISDGRGMI